MQLALQCLEKRMMTNYDHPDGEMAAYLRLICRQGREMQSKLFGHLIQFHGMLELNGDRNDDTFIGNEKWQKQVTGMEPKWEEIRDKVLGAETPMMPEGVGNIIAEAVESEKMDVKKRALLSWILRHDDSGFVPYVVMPKISIKTMELGTLELYELSNSVEGALKKVRAIRKSPLLARGSLTESAAIQEVLSKIKDPMKRAIVLNDAYSDISKYGGFELPVGIMKMLGDPLGMLARIGSTRARVPDLFPHRFGDMLDL